MKILRKMIMLTMITLMIFSIISNTKMNTFASSSLNHNNRKIANIAILLPSFEDFYSIQLKQSLENIQKENENKVKFTFYDGKNNISVQSETLDSLRQDNIDLVIANLADSRENAVEDIISKAKQSNITIIFLGVGSQVIAKVSKLYDKATFTLPNSQEAGTIEGNILVNLWNTNKKVIDNNNDNIMQYIMLKGETDSIIANERTESSISTLNNSGIHTDQLALIHANWSKELAKNAIESLFLRYAGKIEAIISNNDAMALGAIEALQKYGYNKGDKSKHIRFVSTIRNFSYLFL